VRLSGALAASFGQGSEEVLYFEDEVLGRMRAATLALSTPTAAATSVLAAMLHPGRRDTMYEICPDAALLGRLWQGGCCEQTLDRR